MLEPEGKRVWLGLRVMGVAEGSTWGREEGRKEMELGPRWVWLEFGRGVDRGGLLGADVRSVAAFTPEDVEA